MMVFTGLFTAPFAVNEVIYSIATVKFTFNFKRLVSLNVNCKSV